ncbi:MAG TPA: hypothetical protein VFX48_07540, partial [Saprospiraceae bacterium]|nr:hypothetical protein [Saprospiraceae bacterium]
MKSFTTMFLLWALIPLTLPAQKTLFKHHLNRYSYGFSINQLADGNYLLAGKDGDYDLALGISYDLDGNVIWEDTLCS